MKSGTRLSSFGRRVLDRTARLMRVFALLSVVFAVVAALGLRSVHGSVGEAALSLGRQLSELEDLTASSHRLRLNGEPVNLATASVDAPLGAVLDRFERVCASKTLVPEELRTAARESSPEALPVDPDTGVMRRESLREGLVACIVRDRGAASSLSQRLSRFTHTLDLADVGLFRYAYARVTESGRTHVVTMWTDGPFRLGSLIAAGDTDAPGSDPAGAARPIESVRLLSAQIEGTPHSTRVYQSKVDGARVLAGFDSEMPGLGWQSLPLADSVPNARAFSRGGVDLLIFAHEGEGGSVVSMVQSSAGR